MKMGSIEFFQMIRECISSATVLLLAYTGKNLRYFHVRRNAIILRCDWPKSPDWTREFYDWLQRSSRYKETLSTLNLLDIQLILVVILPKSHIIIIFQTHLFFIDHIAPWKMKFHKS